MDILFRKAVSSLAAEYENGLFQTTLEITVLDYCLLSIQLPSWPDATRNYENR